MLSVYADASADRRELIVMAGGGSAPGADREVLRAAKHLEGLTPVFKPSNPPGALVVPLTWAAVVQLQATFTEYFDGWTPGPALSEWITEQIAARGQDFDVTPLAYSPPAGLTPYPWQRAGAAMIAATGRALITDEPGTGKTITTILGLVEWGRAMTRHSAATCPACAHGAERSQCRPGSFRADIGPVIVVCPATVVDPWVEAWKAWAPHVRVVAWRGAPKARVALSGTADVYVTSYETARIDAPIGGTKEMRALVELKPAAVVVDECHLVKNPRAERTKAVHRLTKEAVRQGGAVVGLSGTPITHHPGDLWPMLKAMEPDAWPSSERWIQRYCQTLTGDYREEVLGLLASREPEFRLTLLGQFRRVAKADVLTQLPPKVYSTRTVELPEQWRKVYDDMESQMLAELPDGEELSVMSVLAQLTRLSQLASAPADVEVTEDGDYAVGKFINSGDKISTPSGHGNEVSVDDSKVRTKVTLKAPSWKVDALLEVLAERPGEQVVVFAPSRQLIDLAGGAAAETGRRVGYIKGGQSQTERTRTIEAFQAGDLDVCCVTTGAGGVGITLTAARTCVFLQRPWSLVESIQAEDRLHRIGAEGHESIEVIDIIATRTIDTRIRAVLRERAGQLSDLVQDPRIVRDLLGGSGAKRTSATALPPAHVGGVADASCPPPRHTYQRTA